MIEIRSREYWRPAISDSRGNYYRWTKRGPKAIPWFPWEAVTSYFRQIRPSKTSTQITTTVPRVEDSVDIEV